MIKVLVIDDSALMRKLLGRVLADVTEFEVYFARNGMEGLEQLAAVNPDVVTLDIHMPGMDGLACLDRIMIENPRPVLMVSSSDARGRGCDARGVASGRGGFRAEARRRAFLAHGGVWTAVRRQGACGRGRQAQGEPSPARTRSASHSAEAHQRASALAAPAKRPCGRREMELWWSEPRPAGPRRWRRCSAPCRRLFRGPSSSLSTCPRISPARSPAASTASARSASARSRAPRCSNPATPISGAATPMSLFRRSPAIWSSSPVPADAGRPWHPSADRLVESAIAHVSPSLLIGVLMTGMGDDGAGSMTRLRALGGRTIAEAEETAVVWGMPGKLVEAGGATWVLPLPDIAGQLRKLAPLHAPDPQRV